MQTRWRQRRRARGRLAMPEAAERVVQALIDCRSSGQPDVVLARDVSYLRGHGVRGASSIKNILCPRQCVCACVSSVLRMVKSRETMYYERRKAKSEAQRGKPDICEPSPVPGGGESTRLMSE